MRRFGVNLDDELFEEFLRHFPDYGVRTALVRRCIKRLVERAKVAKLVLDKEALDAADAVFSRLSGL